MLKRAPLRIEQVAEEPVTGFHGIEQQEWLRHEHDCGNYHQEVKGIACGSQGRELVVPRHKPEAPAKDLRWRFRLVCWRRRGPATPPERRTKVSQDDRSGQ